MDTVRSYLDFAVYAFKVGWRGTVSVLIDFLLLASAVAAIVSPSNASSRGAFVITVVLAVCRAVWSSTKLVRAVKTFFKGTTGQIDRLFEIDLPDTRFPIGKLRPSLGEEAEGFAILETKSDIGAVTSREINRRLFVTEQDWSVVTSKRKMSQIRLWIREHREQVLPILSRQIRRAYGRKRFVNEEKMAMATTLSLKAKTVELARVSYFDSYLTNELCTVIVSASSGERLVDGTDLFPAELDLNQIPRIQSLSHSQLANNIGVSTLGFTTDQYLVVWEQSDRAMKSDGLLAPTGSGSADWNDLVPESLRLSIIQAMERELHEESIRSEKIVPRVAVGQSAITGFYRWMSRGGKPEFTGVTRLSVASSDLEPNPSEVRKPSQRLAHCFPVNSIDSLARLAEDLLKIGKLSLPLEVSLRILLAHTGEAETRNKLEAFLFC